MADDYEKEGYDDNDDDVIDDNDFMDDKRKRISIDSFPLDDGDDDDNGNNAAVLFQAPRPLPPPASQILNKDASFLVPYVQQKLNVRPEYQLVDNVSYYNHLALYTLMYGKITQGISTPVIYDAKAQKM